MRTRRGVLLAWTDVHVNLWYPRRRNPCFGAHVRIRGRDGTWTHYRLTCLERNTIDPLYWRRKVRDSRAGFRVRPTLTALELTRWRTERPQHNVSSRLDVKAYVRLKVSAGGVRTG